MVKVDFYSLINGLHVGVSASVVNRVGIHLMLHNLSYPIHPVMVNIGCEDFATIAETIKPAVPILMEIVQ